MNGIPVLCEDIGNIASGGSMRALGGSRLLLTGATGLLGGLITEAVREHNRRGGDPIRLILPVRDMERAERLWGGDGNVVCFRRAVEEITPEDLEETGCPDYVIHLASPTRSRFFVEHPVETLDTVIGGTAALLRAVRGKEGLKRFLYVSSMEMYGSLDRREVTEEEQGYVAPLSLRSTYPAGKRAAELYAAAFCAEYGVPASIARLAMTFGAGIPENDNRVCKYFCDCAAEGKDIVIRSTGRTVLNSVYTTDAVEALLLLLRKGEDRQAYNVVNDDRGFTINDMAEYIRSASGKKIAVLHEGKEAGEYPPDNFMTLSNARIRELGWAPRYDTAQALSRTLDYVTRQHEEGRAT